MVPGRQLLDSFERDYSNRIILLMYSMLMCELQLVAWGSVLSF